jgi:hypothetical protein
MSTQEAEELVLKTEGRLCVRYYQRSDGTVLTADCPVGQSAMQRRVKALAMAGVMFLVSGLAYAGSIGRERQFQEAKARLLETQPIKTVVDYVSPPTTIAGAIAPITGRVATPVAPSKP